MKNTYFENLFLKLISKYKNKKTSKKWNFHSYKKLFMNILCICWIKKYLNYLFTLYSTTLIWTYYCCFYLNEIVFLTFYFDQTLKYFSQKLLTYSSVCGLMSLYLFSLCVYLQWKWIYIYIYIYIYICTYISIWCVFTRVRLCVSY